MTTIVQKWKEPLVVLRQDRESPPPPNPPDIGYQEKSGVPTRWNPYQESIKN